MLMGVSGEEGLKVGRVEGLESRAWKLDAAMVECPYGLDELRPTLGQETPGVIVCLLNAKTS